MNVRIEAVDAGGYDGPDWVSLSVWDGTKKLLDLSVTPDHEVYPEIVHFYKVSVGTREDVRVKTWEMGA